MRLNVERRLSTPLRLKAARAQSTTSRRSAVAAAIDPPRSRPAGVGKGSGRTAAAQNRPFKLRWPPFKSGRSQSVPEVSRLTCSSMCSPRSAHEKIAPPLKDGASFAGLAAHPVGIIADSIPNIVSVFTLKAIILWVSDVISIT